MESFYCFSDICKNIKNDVYEEIKINCGDVIEPYSFITAIFIFIVAIIKLIFKQNIFNCTLLFLGFTSIWHHSRLYTWWINDYIKYLDNLAVVLISIVGFFTLNNKKLWFLFLCYGFFIFSIIASDLVPCMYVPPLHATTHIGIIIVSIFDTCYEN
jgi:hypothetical protein